MSNFDRAVKALNDVDEAIDRVAGNEVYVTALEAAGLLDRKSTRLNSSHD